MSKTDHPRRALVDNETTGPDELVRDDRWKKGQTT